MEQRKKYKNNSLEYTHNDKESGSLPQVLAQHDGITYEENSTHSLTPHSYIFTNKTEQAVSVLQAAYSEKLQIGQMLAAIKLFMNDLEAGIFLVLKPGELRNAWLQQQLIENA